MVNTQLLILIESGEEITELRGIAKHYIKTVTFYIDVLSCIPFDKFGMSRNFKLFGILKIVRIARISKIIANLNIEKSKKAVICILNKCYSC